MSEFKTHIRTTKLYVFYSVLRFNYLWANESKINKTMTL